MRSFHNVFICGCFAILFIMSSCGKSSVNDGLPGKWKLVSHSGGVSYPRFATGEILTLRPGHFYEIKYNDSVRASGFYRVSHLSDPPLPVLYLGSQDYYGSLVRLNKDTLELMYSGPMTSVYPPPTSRFVRIP